MVQDLLIILHVHLDALALCLDSTFTTVSNLQVSDALRVLSHRFALRTRLFQQSCADAQVFANEAFCRGQADERLRNLASQRPKQCK